MYSKGLKMKLFLYIIFLSLTLNAQNVLEDLDNIDPELKKYFPRWKVLEPDLQYQIYQYFKISFDQDNLLDIQNIEILAVPLKKQQLLTNSKYQLLLFSCGDISVLGSKFEKDLPGIYNILAGVEVENTEDLDEVDWDSFRYDDPSPDNSTSIEIRKYAFKDIPVEAPVKPDQGAAIRDYLTPTNVEQALTMSLFDQTLKIGSTFLDSK